MSPCVEINGRSEKCKQSEPQSVDNETTELNYGLDHAEFSKRANLALRHENSRRRVQREPIKANRCLVDPSIVDTLSRDPFTVRPRNTSNETCRLLRSPVLLSEMC